MGVILNSAKLLIVVFIYAMGIFGCQLVITMIVASAIHKLSSYYSLGRWLLVKKLKFYLPPSQRDLQGNRPSAKLNRAKEEDMFIPSSFSINLKSSQLCLPELITIHYYSDFRWLVDFAASSVFVYVCTRIYFYFNPSAIWTEYDLSVVWILMAMLYNVGVLVAITTVYFTNDLSTERSLCLVFTAFFLVCAMAVLIVDERSLEFGLDRSHELLTKSFMNITGFEQEFTMFIFPNWLLKFLLAVTASIMGGLMIFPCFRFAQMHHDALSAVRGRALYRTIYHLNFVLPLVVVTMWVVPISRIPLTTGDSPLITDHWFDGCKIILLIFTCLLRLSLLWPYLQAYLELAKYKVLAMRSGKERVSLAQVQTKVIYIFKFLCTVALQHVTPTILLLTLTLLYQIAHSRQGSPHSLGIGMCEGCFSFLCWWFNFSWIVATTCGTFEHTYAIGHILA